MTYVWCPKCKKEIYFDKLKLGRVISLDKNNNGEVEGLCPRCSLFISQVTLLDIDRLRPKAPKKYSHEFIEWKN